MSSRTLAGAVAAALLLALPVPAALGQEQGPQPARFVAASDDGSRIFFSTREPLVASDRDSSRDIYLRADGQTKLMTGGPEARDGEFPAVGDAITPDGRKLVFSTRQRILREDDDNGSDIYVTDGTGFDVLSIGAPLGGTGQPIEFLAASDDASRVVLSTQEQLVQGDNDRFIDIYASSGRGPRLLTPGLGRERVFFAGATADARHVYFQTDARLTEADADRTLDLYERSSGRTRLVSVSAPPTSRRRFSPRPSFVAASPDGSKVFFQTREALLGRDDDRTNDLYVRTPLAVELVSGPSISGPKRGVRVAFGRDGPAISPNGEKIVLATSARLSGSDRDRGLADLYLRRGPRTSLLSTGPRERGLAGGSSFAGATESLRHIYFSTTEPLLRSDRDRAQDIYERDGSGLVLLTPGADRDGRKDWRSRLRSVSKDGKVAYFVTGAQLVPADRNDGADIYRRSGGKLQCVSLPRLPGPILDVGDNDEQPLPILPKESNASGSAIVFVTAKQLLAADRDELADVYEARDGRVTLVS